MIVADYFSDNIRPRHGQRIPDPHTHHDWVYDENTQDWVKESYEERLEKSAYPVSQIYVPGLTHSKAASGMVEAKKLWPGENIPLPPLPQEPEEKPITDFDFDEEDFEL